jgi:hypothetical protein
VHLSAIYAEILDFYGNLKFLQKFAESVSLSAERYIFMQKFYIFAISAGRVPPFCRNLKFAEILYFLQKGAHFLQKVCTFLQISISEEILHFCNFCRKGIPFCRFLQRGAHFLQKSYIFVIYAEIAEILNFCREVHTFCRNLKFLQFLQEGYTFL